MSRKLPMAALAAACLALGACGGGSGGGRSHGTPGAGKPVRLFRVQLTGAAVRPQGARGGIGSAVLALHHHAVVCFRFAHLGGFTGARSAALYAGRVGQRGSIALELSRGTRLHHRGCVRATRTLGAALERTPAGYYVQILSSGYPQGAVRGQL